MPDIYDKICLRDMRSFVEKSAFVLMAAMTISQSVFATEKNNLVKMDLNKVLYDTVRLNLYTSQPYEEQVFVNKKEDNTYTILLPETSNRITQNSLSSTNIDVITNVDVKTQQGVDKNYTKITIKSSIPIELIPRVKVVDLNAQRISDTEANELISESKKIQPDIEITQAKKLESIEPNSIQKQAVAPIQNSKTNQNITPPINQQTNVLKTVKKNVNKTKESTLQGL